MREITRSAVNYVREACPGARIERRGFDDILIVPKFDIESGEQKTVEYKVIDDPKPN